MPWIESHSVIGRHRKFKGLARQLKIPLAQAIGHMHLLWHTVIEQAEDGDLSTWTVGAISESACWEGSEQEFLKAVQENGLMDEQRIHDWLEYAGKYLTSKYKTSNPDKLHDIWSKFGKIYGKEVKRNSLVVPKGSPHNLTEQNITVPTKQKDKPQLGVWFGDERFSLAWKAWSGERKKKPGAMQYADLENLSKGDIETAIAILNQSAVKQWTGLFELKGAKTNEHRTQKTGREFDESLRL